MSWRNLEINGGNWRFKIGRANLDIRSPDHRSFRPLAHVVKGVSEQDFHDAKRDGSSVGMIGPGDVRKWIEANCVSPAKQE